MRTGAQNRTGVLIPRLASIRLTTTLSRDAKQRLKWVDYYHQHGNNARLTCRHFGIAHRTFYRYYNRFKLQGLRGLENQSCRLQQVRHSTTLPGRTLPRTNLTWSASLARLNVSASNGVVWPLTWPTNKT